MSPAQKVSIIGGGPAGLFCASLLLEKGFEVDLYDHSSGLAKKFLIAGKGGLNLTHSEDLDIFASRYGKDEALFQKLLKDFSPTDLRNWCEELGVETFVGSSGRVFPKSFKAAEILLKWIEKLKSYEGFTLHLKHKFIGLTKDKELTFENPDGKFSVQAESIVFALGGASWKKTGSDGSWKTAVESLGVKVNDFLPMNCGFERPWSDYFKKEIDHSFLKNIALTFKDKSVKGEMMLTPYGVEGGVIYALSNYIRDEILKNGSAKISLDLKPALSLDALIEKLKKRKSKSSLSNHLRKALGFDKEVFILLKECLAPEDFDAMETLAKKIKNFEIELFATRPLDEAISTSGGVCFSELNESMELKQIPGIYFSGEMLDFEAPTGGYLLQACFSTAWAVVKGLKVTL